MTLVRIPRLTLLPLLALGLWACAAEDAPADDPFGEDLPLGEMDDDDLKADGYWGAATTCKEIPDLPALVDPAIVISVDGLTLHLVDRAGDYDQIFPVGVGTIDDREDSLTLGESRTMYPVLRTGIADFAIDTTEAADFATRTGRRTGSLSTKVVKRIRSVTAPIAGISENGSMKGLSSRKLRSPSGV